MIEWLESRETWRPRRVDQPPAGAGAHVTPSFQEGSIILQRGDRAFTLAWSRADKDRRRALPAGEYRLRTTRIVREQGDAWWFLSQTGPGKRRVVVAERGATKLSVDDRVLFKARAKRHGGKLNLGFGIMGTDRRGMSIYRDGKRVPVTYRVLDKKGKVLAEGRMNYG